MSLQFTAVDPKDMQVAISAYIKHWAKMRNDAGESTQEIAKSVGLKSHASVVQWFTHGHPGKISATVQDHVARLSYGGSRDRLKDAAIAWFESNQQLPPEFKAAVTLLNETHGRDFTAAANEVFRDAAHKARRPAIEELAAQIAQRDAERRGKAVGVRELED